MKMNKTLSSLTMIIGLGILLITATSFAAPPQPGISKANPQQQNQQFTPPWILTVTSPKNGDYWSIGDPGSVAWNYSAAAGKYVNIWLVKGNSPTQKIVGNLDIENTVHSWVVPGSITPGTDYRVMIESVEHPAYKTYSTGFFTIRKIPTEIRVMMPNGGQSWTRGTTQNIGWMYTHKPGATVKITLERPGVPPLVLAENYGIYQQIQQFGSFGWNIPGNLTPASDYRIKIQVTNTQYVDTSDQPFTIK